MHSLRPARALLHPAWLGALALMALNDHLLKGADVLPPLVTGKLSDFAGLFLAPTLLAALLRVRSERGLVASAVAVGAVFSAIQLSAPLAATWDAGMGALGWPWRTHADPTDLLALPMIIAGLTVLAPSMRRPVPTRARRGAEVSVALVGTTLCMATSRGGPGEEYAWFEATAYLSNPSELFWTVRVRPLRDEVVLDCDAVAQDPALLDARLFDAALTWEMPPHTSVPLILDETFDRDCRAVRIEVDGSEVGPVIAFWRADEVPADWIPGSTDDGYATLGQIAMTVDEVGVHQGFQPALPIVFDIGRPAEIPAICATEPTLRPEWTNARSGTWRIDRIDEGLDDCTGFELEDPENPSAAWRWTLCLEPGWQPFREGDSIAIEDGPGRLRVVRMDDGQPSLIGPILEVSAGGLPELGGYLFSSDPLGCPLASEPECGTLEQSGTLWVDPAQSEPFWLETGTTTLFHLENDWVAEMGVFHHTIRAAVDPTCAGGRGTGPDVDAILLLTRAL